MLARMSLTPSVMTVRRGIGAGGWLLMLLSLIRLTLSSVIARSASDEAIHSFFPRRDGLLRFARNDGGDNSVVLEQTQLLSALFRSCKMVGRQLRAPLVETELFAGDFEPAADHPGHRAGALHPRTPLRVVVAPAAHIADQGEDVAIAVGIIGHQPFAEEVAHF